MSISGIGSTYTPPVGGAGTGQHDSKVKGRSAEDEFLSYMEKTPAERMREAILGSMGMTEEQLAGMDAAEREKIEQKIRETIRAKVEEDTEKRTGMIVDMSV
ncbi:hypothetical protein [Oceanibaculum pacificum]|uniref:Uncharacterized protein n=1 Tax=Oceanibaculum pacificum TaxID=580166 RepID=A0A154W8E4_9PROT|nr:hypothetical protein [Oceanibaculum pacificum]KZD09804.1 hypothetical protein AUP43_01090 [Oceanibaculum pacificum]